MGSSGSLRRRRCPREGDGTQHWRTGVGGASSARRRHPGGCRPQLCPSGSWPHRHMTVQVNWGAKQTQSFHQPAGSSIFRPSTESERAGEERTEDQLCHKHRHPREFSLLARALGPLALPPQWPHLTSEEAARCLENPGAGRDAGRGLSCCALNILPVGCHGHLLGQRAFLSWSQKLVSSPSGCLARLLMPPGAWPGSVRGPASALGPGPPDGRGGSRPAL